MASAYASWSRCCELQHAACRFVASAVHPHPGSRRVCCQKGALDPLMALAAPMPNQVRPPPLLLCWGSAAVAHLERRHAFPIVASHRGRRRRLCPCRWAANDLEGQMLDDRVGRSKGALILVESKPNVVFRVNNDIDGLAASAVTTRSPTAGQHRSATWLIAGRPLR